MFRLDDESPPRSAATIPVAVWIDHGADALATALATDLAQELETAWGWRIHAVGGERRALVTSWAARTGAQEMGTLRELGRCGAQLLLVLSRESPADADLDVLVEGDLTVVVTAPAPPSLVEAHRLGDRVTRLRTVPLFRWSDAFRTAQPMIEEFLTDGPPRSINVRVRAGPDPSGLHTMDGMLADACDVVLELVNGVEHVVAFARPASGGEEARFYSALARTDTGGIVAIDLADTGGWCREVELIGSAGRLRIEDGLIRRWDRTGQQSECHELAAADPPVTNSVSACIEALRTVARLRLPREEPQRLAARLAFMDAARLSARTGNAESPSRMDELAARP